MNAFLSSTISNDALLRALSWTLVHSLWQGLLLSFLAAMIIRLTKRSTPLLRYNLIAASLMLFLAGVVITFIYHFEIVNPCVGATTIQNGITQQIGCSTNVAIQSEPPTAIMQVMDYINANAIWIVSIWLLIIIIKFIHLGKGFYQIHQLKKTQVFSAGTYWNEKLIELCQQLNIHKKVALLQSGIVTIPSVIGYFKPVILFPAALINTLSVQEVEAILLHELGHIRRNDFLVNLLQNVVEIFFFFNPAVFWVSSLIKSEREHCCDDIAVTFTGNKINYIKAIIHFLESGQQNNPSLVTAFSGEKNHLLHRTKRMMNNKNKDLSSMEKKFLSASLILVSICLLTFISIDAQNTKHSDIVISQSDPAHITKIIEPELITAPIDTTKVYKIGGNRNLTGRMQKLIDGKEYEIIVKNSIVTEMYIDGKKIPSEKIITYKPLLDQVFAQMVKNSEQAMKRDQEQANRDREQADRDQEQANRDREQATKDREQADRDREQANRDREQAIKDRKQAIKDRKQATKDRAQAIKDREQAIKDREQAIRDQEQAIRDQEQAIKDQEVMNEIVADLIREHIITSENELKTLKFNAKELIVNGIQQPIAIHKRFKEKYQTSESWSFGIINSN